MGVDIIDVMVAAVAKEAAQGAIATAKRVSALVVQRVGSVVVPAWDQMTDRMRGHSYTLLFDASDVLEDAGAEPAPVPPRLLVPVLQKGCLVGEDDPLRQRWVNLLANAADKSRQSKVLPAFPSILEQLSSLDAALLDKLYVHNGYDKSQNGIERAVDDLSLTDAISSFEVALDDIQATTANLERQNLVVMTYPARDIIDMAAVMNMTLVRLTPFGISFTRACRNDRLPR
jgi:hypothetical protein